MTARMFKDGLRVVPPVLIAPFEVVVARESQDLPPQTVKIEYDEDGLHFITDWGMTTINSSALILEQEDINVES